MSKGRSRKAAPKKDLSIPVLYVTDRDEDPKENYGSKRRYVIDCKHEMFYGTANVVVKNSDNKTDGKVLEALGWKPEPQKDTDEVSCDKIKAESSETEKAEFFKRLEAAMIAAGSDRVCLFVHGADEGFNDAARDAAALAYSLEYPLVFYSWPSVPKTFSYVVDGGNNEWSQAHFNTFIRDLLEFRKSHKLDLIIVSHSMGNRLVIRAAAHMERTQLVKDAELVSPDIDAETFKHYVMGMENQGAVLRLYTSTRDKMLPLSQMVYGGYYRLGEGVGDVFGGLKKSDKDDDNNQKGGDKQEADADVNVAASSGNHMPHHKRGLVERIDFTEIDEGLSGHSIPFSMLASMIHTDLPGKGLALVSSKPGKGSRLARFMSWTHHLGKIDDDGDTDLCKRIIKSTDESLKTGSQPSAN